MDITLPKMTVDFLLKELWKRRDHYIKNTGDFDIVFNIYIGQDDYHELRSDMAHHRKFASYHAYEQELVNLRMLDGCPVHVVTTPRHLQIVLIKHLQRN